VEGSQKIQYQDGRLTRLLFRKKSGHLITGESPCDGNLSQDSLQLPRLPSYVASNLVGVKVIAAI